MDYLNERKYMENKLFISNLGLYVLVLIVAVGICCVVEPRILEGHPLIGCCN